MFGIISFLSKLEILQLSRTCKNLLIYLNSDQIWELLWKKDFSKIWNDPLIKTLRDKRNIKWDPNLDNLPPDDNDSVTSNVNQISSSIESYRFKPAQGWKRFYLEFEYCWMDWLLAGFCTSEKCYIGLNGNILDITSFLDDHPGSPETLTDNSGGDATVAFFEIGHSSFAHSLLGLYTCWSPSRVSSSVPSTPTSIINSQDVSHTTDRRERLKTPFGQTVDNSYAGFRQFMSKKQRLLKRYEFLHANSLAAISRGSSANNLLVTSDIPRTTTESGASNTSNPQASSSSSIFTTFKEAAVSTSELSLHLLSRHIDAFNYKSLDYEFEKEISAYSNINGTLSETPLASSRMTSRKNLKRVPHIHMVPGLTGYHNCPLVRYTENLDTKHTMGEEEALHGNDDQETVSHTGQARVIYDPVNQVWWCWWSCCGRGYPCRK
jgi:cytochrome b involved in lipid metabolism